MGVEEGGAGREGGDRSGRGKRGWRRESRRRGEESERRGHHTEASEGPQVLFSPHPLFPSSLSIFFFFFLLLLILFLLPKRTRTTTTIALAFSPCRGRGTHHGDYNFDHNFTKLCKICHTCKSRTSPFLCRKFTRLLRSFFLSRMLVGRFLRCCDKSVAERAMTTAVSEAGDNAGMTIISSTTV